MSWAVSWNCDSLGFDGHPQSYLSPRRAQRSSFVFLRFLRMSIALSFSGSVLVFFPREGLCWAVVPCQSQFGVFWTKILGKTLSESGKISRLQNRSCNWLTLNQQNCTFLAPGVHIIAVLCKIHLRSDETDGVSVSEKTDTSPSPCVPQWTAEFCFKLKKKSCEKRCCTFMFHMRFQTKPFLLKSSCHGQNKNDRVLMK